MEKKLGKEQTESLQNKAAAGQQRGGAKERIKVEKNVHDLVQSQAQPE